MFDGSTVAEHDRCNCAPQDDDGFCLRRAQMPVGLDVTVRPHPLCHQATYTARWPNSPSTHDAPPNRMDPDRIFSPFEQVESSKTRQFQGSGLGLAFFILENVDYDIQTTCPETIEEYDLKTLRLGDIVAIEDHYDCYGRGRYEDAVTIGVVIHGWSEAAGHGPGLNPILSALPGRIKVKIDPDANIAYYLGIREK